MAVDKCLTEVKRVVKDLLTDDEINLVLTKVKSNSSENSLQAFNT